MTKDKPSPTDGRTNIELIPLRNFFRNVPLKKKIQIQIQKHSR